MKQDFVAIRIGDLDGDVSLSTIRNKSKKSLQVADRFVQAGQSTKIMLQAPKEMNMAGMLLALDVDASTIDLDNILSLVSGVSLDYNTSPNGTVVISMISDGLSTTIQKSQLLLSFNVTSTKDALLSQMIKISETTIKSEIADQGLEMSDIQLEFTSEEATISQVSVYPNPTNRIATIEVLSQQGFDVGQLIIYDVAGRQLLSQEVAISKGQNTIILDKQVLNLNKGIIYYDLTFGDESHKGKIIIVE